MNVFQRIVFFLNVFHGIPEETPLPEASIFPSFTRMLVSDHTCLTAKKPEETLQIKKFCFASAEVTAGVLVVVLSVSLV